MGTSLTGLTPATTYDALIKVGDNSPLTSTLKRLSDGLGNDSAISLSTLAMRVDGSTTTIGSAGTPALYLTNSDGNAGTAQQYATLGTSATAIATLFRGNGLSGTTANGLNIDNFGGFQVRVNQLGGSGDSINLLGGNVGIGTSTPESKLHVADGVSGGIVSIFVDNNINALNSTAQIKFTVDAGGSLTVGGAAIQAVNTDPNYANTDLVFRNSHISSGSLVEVFRLTDGARYLRMASGTGGIQFNGDTAAANALDDYEEGTFTLSTVPAISGTISLSNNSARYTKIGRQVFVQAFITVSSVSSPIGTAILFQGLPFTIANATDAGGSSMVVWADASVSYVKTVLPGFYLGNTTQIYAPIDASLVQANDEFFITMTYTV